MKEQSIAACSGSEENLSVERVAIATLPTEWGDFQIAGYRSLVSDEEFVALFKGEMRRDTPTLVRIHSQCLTGDVFGSTKCDCGPQLHQTMQMIERAGRGAVVYQLQEGRGIGIIKRDYKQCAEVLFDLGLCQVRVISNNPLKLRALEEAGLRIVERVSIQVEQPEQAGAYLRTKKEKLGHLLDFSAG